MLTCYNSLEDAMKEACACFLPYWELVEELGVCIDVIRYAEEICKNEESVHYKRTISFAISSEMLIQDVLV